MPSQRWKSGGHRDSGVVAVETAAVSMFLILLLMGIAEASFFLKDWVTVSAASRAGARMGSSQSKIPGFGTSTADQVTNSISGIPPQSLVGLEMWVYDASSTTGLPTASGVVPSANNCTTRCLKYTWSVASSKLVPASTPGTWSSVGSTNQNACIGDPLRTSLGVYVKFAHFSPLGFFFQNLTVADSTMMWLEPYTPTSGCKT
jgi:hypothetical protein